MSATTSNDGGADGSFVANLLIDDEVVESRELTIAAGGRRQLRFEQPIEETGSYSVRVNDAVAGEVMVTRDVRNDAGNSTAAATVTSSDGSSRAFGPLGFVNVVVAFLLAAGLGYVRSRSG